jgi:hypothetical protein
MNEGSQFKQKPILYRGKFIKPMFDRNSAEYKKWEKAFRETLGDPEEYRAKEDR